VTASLPRHPELMQSGSSSFMRRCPTFRVSRLSGTRQPRQLEELEQRPARWGSISSPLNCMPRTDFEAAFKVRPKRAGASLCCTPPCSYVIMLQSRVSAWAKLPTIFKSVTFTSKQEA